MSYLALARKWRPRTFADVVGQPHIVRALTNALAAGRVHHAFLFAGTRGVGKTTVARILARCLNCEKGVSAEPCGECPACRAIDEGRFVDLIEVDAASRTGVDDIRELLDNVQYTPSVGRFKVYLVDEVHMLSKPAFNALLKTLEEPPPHVKFLFATTDPQRLPVTVLSRCLQFNLKKLPVDLIVERMRTICAAEGLGAEPGALRRLARAAAGSMRDALSLLDQALAFGDGQLREADVTEMLGSLDGGRVMALLRAVADGDAKVLLALVREIEAVAPDFGALLEELAERLQKLAVIQLAGAGACDDEEDAAALAELATTTEPEAVQLYYQIAVLGRRDLHLAPDARLGFEMTLLRMMAFHPTRAGLAAAAPAAGPPSGPVRGAVTASRTTAPGRLDDSAAAPPREERQALSGPGDWPAFVGGLALDGAARQLAMHAHFIAISPFELRLGVDRAGAHLVTEQLRGRLATAVRQHLGDAVALRLEVTDLVAGDTAAARSERQEEEAMQRAREAIETDPNVRELADLLGAEVVSGSIKPLRRTPDETPAETRAGANNPQKGP